MDSKKLEALAAAAEHGSFTRAAQQLGYTQSGLTHMMNSLEREIGFPVLVRDRRGVHLTPAGQRILPMVQQCLAANQALEREIAMINSHQEDTIRVGSYASIAMHWLPELIEQFRRRHEGVGVDVQMGSVKEVYRWVREGRVDMAFTSRQENSTLDWTPLKPDPLLVILPRDFDTGGAASLDVRRLEGISDAIAGFSPGYHAGTGALRRDPHHPGYAGQRHRDHLHGRAWTWRQYPQPPCAEGPL